MSAISAVSGPRRSIMSATLSERKNERPKIAAQDVLHPVQVLHPQRVAQAEVSHVVRALVLGELGEALGAEDRDQRIAGQDTHHDEDHDRDADHRNHPEGEPTDDVAVHACPRRDPSGRTVVVLPTADARTPAMSRPQCARRRAALSRALPGA